MINTTSNLYFYKPAYNDDIIIFLNYQKLRLTRLSFLSQKKKKVIISYTKSRDYCIIFST